MIGDPKSRASITGRVSSKASITATIDSSTVLGDINAGRLNIVHTPLPDYEGPYYVEPRIGAQTLLTTNKTLRHNLVVDSMRYTARQNEYGGLTIYIGPTVG